MCLSARLVRQGQSFTPPHDSGKVTDEAMVLRDGLAGAGAMGAIRLKCRSLRKGPKPRRGVVLGRRPAHKPSRANRLTASALARDQGARSRVSSSGVA